MKERIKAWNVWRKGRRDLCPICKLLILLGIKQDKGFDFLLAIRRINAIAKSFGYRAKQSFVDETPPKEEPNNDGN